MIIRATNKDTLSVFEKKIIIQSLENEQAVAFPTDTVYGLGVNGFSQNAIQRLYQLKGRDHDKPLILFSDSIQKIKPFVIDLDDQVQVFLKENWPGPTTIVLPFNQSSSLLFSLLPSLTLAIRIPCYPLMLDLLSSLPFPLVTTSANKTGLNALVNASEIELAFDSNKDGLSIVIDGGTIISKPSKIVTYKLGVFSTLRS